MNLLKSRRSSASANHQPSSLPRTSENTSPWRHMGGENSAFKALVPHSSSESLDRQNGRRYASSETSEEINVTTDDEDSNLSHKFEAEEQRLTGFVFNPHNGPCEELDKLGQTDMRASIESWREMSALNAFRAQHVPPSASQPLPLTKYDRDRVL